MTRIEYDHWLKQARFVARQSLDATELVSLSDDQYRVLLKARVAALEGDASAFWTKQITWLKANWPHLVTWATSATVAVKLGVLADIAKIL